MLKIVNSKGEQIVLNEVEQQRASFTQMYTNALGFDIDITTLTQILKKVSEQKFFQIAPADYLPVQVGEGAWSQSILKYRAYSVAGDFDTGILNTGSNNTRLAAADTGVDAVSVPVINWAKSIGWNTIELQYALKAGNWDLVTAKEKSRKMNWDLGIQKVAFLGLLNNSSCLGLYNQSGITTNTTLITQPLSTLDPATFNIVLQNLVEVYRSNNNRTAWGTHFIIPETDYNGLVAQMSPDFPIKTKLEVLRDSLKSATMNPNFKVLPCAYGDSDNFSDGLLHYAFLNYDSDSMAMNLPVDYTSTLANSIDNFMFQNTAYGQFTGVVVYRPLELLYLTCAPVSLS